MTNIRDHLASAMTLEDFRTRLLERMLPPESARLALTAEQEAEVRRLRDEKYKSWAWTWGKTPAFTYEKTGVFAGEPIRAAYQAKRGVVSDAEIDCAALDGGEAARLLNGRRLDPEGFAAICRTLVGERAEELMDWLLCSRRHFIQTFPKIRRRATRLPLEAPCLRLRPTRSSTR